MDIVHLIETQMNKSVQEQTSRTYAEIEKTLDHSEGSNAFTHSTQQIFKLTSLLQGMPCKITNLLMPCGILFIVFLIVSVSRPILGARGCR